MSNKFEYISIQYLRGMAALGVVACHLEVQFPRLGSNLNLPEFLSAGVDIFFVISGFIMWTTTYSSNTTPAQFFRKRLTRIVPLYWLVTSVMVLTALAVPSALQSGTFDLNHIISSYLFLPYPHPVVGFIYPVLVQGWTLNYEMFFYAIFGLSLFLPVGIRLWAVGAVLVAFSALGTLLSPENTALRFWTDGIILEFLFGMLIAAALAGNRMNWGRPAAYGLIALGVLAMLIPQSSTYGWQRALSFGVPSTAILLGAVLLDRQRAVGHWRLPRLFGDASYSIYLSHGITLSGLSHLWQHFALGGSPMAILAFSTLGFASSVIVGLAVYFLIEKPLIAAFGRRHRPAHA